MKKIFTLLLVCLLGCLSASAQGGKMRVHKTDGSTIVMAVDEIQSIDFAEGYALAYERSHWYMHPNQTLHLILYSEEADELLPIAADAWESSNPAVATVNAEGEVKALSAGKTAITATYDGDEVVMTVDVVEGQTFALDITNIKNTSCDYSIKPNSATVKYYYNMRLLNGQDFSIESMTDHGSREENIYYFTCDWFKFQAENYGMSWKDVVEMGLTTGPVAGPSTDFYSSKLTPGEEYCLYAFGLDENGQLTTPVETCIFQTTAPAASSNTFGITIGECTTQDAKFTVKPSNKDSYFVNIQRASYVDWFIENNRVGDMATNLAATFADDARYPSVNVGTKTFKASDFVNIRSNEDYYVIVFGYDDGITTDVKVKRFRTENGWEDSGRDVIKTVLPDGITTYTCVFEADDYFLDDNNEEQTVPIDPMEGRIAQDGDKVYLYGIFGMMSEMWAQGTYDAEAKTLTVPYPQYLGTFDYGTGYQEPMYLLGGNMKTQKMCDLVFNYDEQNKVLRLDEDQAVILSTSSTVFQSMMNLLNYTITLTEPLK